MYQMEITVPKQELLERVRANRDKHRQTFEAALDGYRLHAMAVLEAQLKALSDGRTPEIRITVARPADHTRDYDRVIGMLEMHTADDFTLDEQTFAQYVDDDWDWKRQWLRTSSQYAAGTTQANYDYVEE